MSEADGTERARVGFPDIDRPLVSVITVCRNAAATLGETLASILAQTYPRVEAVVVDGASSDGSVELIRSYAERSGGSLRWISEPDAGIYAAMNTGLALSSGELVAFLNADDRYEPQAVEKAVRVYLEGGRKACLVAGRICVADRRGRRLYYQGVAPDPAARVAAAMPVHHPALFIARAAFQSCGTFDTAYRYAADYDFVFRAARAGVPFLVTDADLAVMRLGGVSSVGTPLDLPRAREDFRIRRAHGAEAAAWRGMARDLLAMGRRRLKRLLLGRLVVYKPFDLDGD